MEMFNIQVLDKNFSIPINEETRKNRIIENSVSELNSAVYKHILPNNKVYYGITRQKPIKKRWNKGRNYKNNKKFYLDIQNFGWENIKHEVILDYCNLSLSFFIEYAYILKDKTYLHQFGYNHEKVNIDYFLSEYTSGDFDCTILDYVLDKIANTNIKQLKENNL